MIEPWLLRRLAKHELTDADKAWCRELARLMRSERALWSEGEGLGIAKDAAAACEMRAFLDPHGISRGKPQMETFAVTVEERREPIARLSHRVRYTTDVLR